MTPSGRPTRAIPPLAISLLTLGVLTSLASSRPGWSRGQTAALPQAFNITVVDRLDALAPAVLNDAGQVAGIARAAGQQPPGDLVRWDPDTGYQAFGQPFGENIDTIRDMNALGEIVGDTEHRAFFMRSDGSFPVLHDGRGVDLRNAFAVNDSSQAVFGEGPNNFGVGGVWKDGVFTELADFPADVDNPFARGINAQGKMCGAIAEIVNGLAEQHAVLWGDVNSPVDISPDNTATQAQFADSVNASSQVLGWTLNSSSGQPVFLAWLRQAGGTRLNIGPAQIQGALGTQGVITGWRLNDSGLVLINLNDTANNRIGYYLWQNGQSVRYDTSVPAASGYTLGPPLDMNNSGQILAFARANSIDYAVILTPKAVDTLAPVISNVAPAQGATSTTPVHIQADIADTSSVLWSATLDKADFKPIRVNGVTKGTGAISFDQALAGGAHTLDIEVHDSSGNVSSVTRAFSVDTHATLKSFSFTPSTVKGGAKITGNIELTSPAPAGGLRLTFKSSKKKTLKPPKAFTIPEGAITPSFEFKTPKVKHDASFTITAKLGDVSKEAVLNLTRH